MYVTYIHTHTHTDTHTHTHTHTHRYLTYGEPEWKAAVVQHIENTCEMFSSDTRSRFMNAVDWPLRFSKVLHIVIFT